VRCSATGGLQHPLDQIPDLIRTQDRRRQLTATTTGDEHPARRVDPVLLNQPIIEIGLQRTEPGDRVNEPADRSDITRRIQPTTAHQLAHPVLDNPNRIDDSEAKMATITKVRCRRLRKFYDITLVWGRQTEPCSPDG
jgi:hypothetical protein